MDFSDWSTRDKAVLAAFALIVLAAFAFRFHDLAARPMHHDEGVIGWFKMNIMDACLKPTAEDFANPVAFIQKCGSSYSYDPDFHGPFEYLFGAWVFRIFGDSDFTLRAPECLFNVLTIALLWPLRRKLGDVGLLTAAALLAVSPSMVYFAQRAYMDNFFIFFTLAAIMCAVKLFETKRPVWAYVLAADLALMFTTKETAFIFVAIGAGFLALEGAIAVMRNAQRTGKIEVSFEPSTITPWLGVFGGAALVFAVIYVFVFSTMFADPLEAVKGASNGLTFWLNRSTSWEGHFKPWDYYLKLLLTYEPVVLLLAASVVLFSLFRIPRELKGEISFAPLFASLFSEETRFARWLAFWAVATIAIFSYVPYKTPWLDVHFILPLSLVAGAGVQSVARLFRIAWSPLVFVIALVLLPLPMYSATVAYDVTFVHYGDDTVGLVYVSGVDSYNVLLGRLENETARMGGTQNAEIALASSDQWPLPWSLRHYNVSYAKGPDLTAPLIISSKNDFSDIRESLRQEYTGPEKYDLRPGATVYLYVKR